MAEPAPALRRRASRVALGVLLGALLGAAMLLFLPRRGGGALPDLGRLPDFSLVDSGGRPVTAADLDGHVTVVDFFFTRCTSQCPLLTERMRKVAAWGAGLPSLAGRLQLLSISVDPENDNPAALSEYKLAHHVVAGPGAPDWRFVTGSADAVAKVADHGFHVAIGAPQRPAAGSLEIVHSGHLILVDGERHIRGYFGDRESESAALREAILRLALPPPTAAPGAPR